MSEGRGYARSELQTLAEQRLADARLLLEHDRFSSAYYLAGYSVELALKACLAKAFRADTLPDPGFVRRLYVHDLSELMRLAALVGPREETMASDAAFAANWLVVAEWDVSSRYDIIESPRSRRLIDAVGDPEHGVFAWLKTRW